MKQTPILPKLLFAALLLIPLVAADKVKIALLRQVEIKSLCDAEDGVKKGLDASKYEFVSVDLKGDMGQIPATLENFRKAKVALIVTIGTKATIETLKLEKGIPIVFSGVAYSEPVLKAAKDNGNANVTGACYGNAVEPSVAAAQKIKAGLKTVGMLVNSLEPNTRMDGDSLEASCRKLGIKAVLLSYAGEPELAAAFPKLLDLKADAILLPHDTVQIRNAGELAKSIASRKVLALGLDPAYAAGKAAVLSTTTPAGKIGELSAKKALEILGGKSPSSIAVEAPADFEITLNKKAAAESGVAVPADVAKSATKVLE